MLTFGTPLHKDKELTVRTLSLSDLLAVILLIPRSLTVVNEELSDRGHCPSPLLPPSHLFSLQALKLSPSPSHWSRACVRVRARESGREGRPALCHVRLIETHAECATSKAEPASEPASLSGRPYCRHDRKKREHFFAGAAFAVTDAAAARLIHTVPFSRRRVRTTK